MLSTLTYLIADDETKEAVIIDPVSTHIEHYIALVKQGELTIYCACKTG